MENILGHSNLEQLDEGMFIEHVVPREIDVEETEDINDFVFGHMAEVELQGLKLDNAGTAELLFALDFFTEEAYEKIREYVLPVECGTSMNDISFALTESGYEVDELKDAEFDELMQALAQDERVLCFVLEPFSANTEFREKHVVEVCGIDMRSIDNPMVCLSDAEGKKNEPAKMFLKAWQACGQECLIAYRGANDEYQQDG